MDKDSKEGGNPAASKRMLKRWYMLGRREVKEVKTKVCERRRETEKGNARNAEKEVKY